MPSELPAFNRLQEDVEVFARGHLGRSALAESLEALDLALGTLHDGFFEELDFREQTPLVGDVADVVDEASSMLRPLLQQAREAVAWEDARLLQAILAEMQPHVDGMVSSLRLLHEEDGRREPVSESPYVDELVRVGQLYLRGRLPLHAFQARFEAFVDYHINLVVALEALQPTRREQPAAQAMSEIMHRAIEKQAEGLEHLRQFFVSLEERDVMPALYLVVQGAADLVRVCQELQDASDRAGTTPCLRCGQSNPSSSRYCGRCSAPLLFVMSEEVAEEPALDFTEVTEDSHTFMPANLQRLADACERARGGDASAMLEEIEATRGRVRTVLERLGRLPAPPPDTPPEQMQAFETARQGLEDGCRLMAEALRVLETFPQAPDPRLLDRGLEAVIEAADRITEPARVWGRLLPDH